MLEGRIQLPGGVSCPKGPKIPKGPGPSFVWRTICDASREDNEVRFALTVVRLS